MVLEHALVDAAGDRTHFGRLAGAPSATRRVLPRRGRVVAVRHEGRRVSFKVRVVLAR